MSNLPNTPEYDPFAGNPVIDRAEQALRAFEGADPLTRDQAARLLSMWAHDSELTERERTAVLARFPSPATVEGLAISEPETAIEHAFTVARIVYEGERRATTDVFGHDFMWTCRCGYQAVQLAGDVNITVRLAEHANGGRAQREIAEYRKRLDAWSKDQQIEAAQRDREQSGK